MAEKPQLSDELRAEIAQFCEERDAVLRRLDPAELRAFMAKNGETVPPDFSDERLLAAAHVGRLNLNTFTDDEKAVSRAWLAEHGHGEPRYGS